MERKNGATDEFATDRSIALVAIHIKYLSASIIVKSFVKQLTHHCLLAFYFLHELYYLSKKGENGHTYLNSILLIWIICKSDMGTLQYLKPFGYRKQLIKLRGYLYLTGSDLEQLIQLFAVHLQKNLLRQWNDFVD